MTVARHTASTSYPNPMKQYSEPLGVMLHKHQPSLMPGVMAYAL